MKSFRVEKMILYLLGIMMCISCSVVYAEGGKEFYFEDVDKFKVWTIEFTQELQRNEGEDFEAILTDGTGRIQRLKLEKGSNKKKYIINPPNQGYRDSENKLVIPNTVKDKNGNKLDMNYTIRFTVDGGLKVKNVLQENNPFIEGDTMSVFVSSSEEEMVQYRVDVADSNGKIYSQTDGYEHGVLGTTVQKFNLEKLKKGEYKLIVYVKFDDKEGEKTAGGIDYEDKYETSISVQALSSNSLADKKLLFDGNYIKLENRYLLSKESAIDNLRLEGLDGAQFEVFSINIDKGRSEEKILSYGEKLNWNPSGVEEYLLRFDIKDSKDKYIGSKSVSVKTEHVDISYEDYNMTLDEFAKKEKYNQKNTIRTGNNYVSNATIDQIKYYLDPNNFMDEYGIFQFMVLNYVEGMSVEDMDEILKGKGILDGKGAAVLEGARKHDINPAYLIAHIILETGHGRSKLANGISVDGNMVYNMYGIQAVDSNPLGKGSRYAHKQGWFTPEVAIIEGAQWVGENYINSEKFQQNTLYEMKWNKDIMWHQYSTDVKWAYGQIRRIKQYLNGKSKIEMILKIPRFE